MTAIRQAATDLLAAAADGRLDQLSDQQGLMLVVLFGSAVEQDAVAAPQDLDIAVLPHDVQTFDRVGCHTAFVDLLHDDRIDLLDLSTAGVLARARALGDGVPLYERTSGLYAREQMRAVGMAMELGWLTDLELELLAAR